MFADNVELLVNNLQDNPNADCAIAGAWNAAYQPLRTVRLETLLFAKDRIASFEKFNFYEATSINTAALQQFVNQMNVVESEKTTVICN
jgi:hypothetical protein